jgi:hypothetical protein
MSVPNLFYPKKGLGTRVWELEQSEFVFRNYGSMIFQLGIGTDVAQLFMTLVRGDESIHKVGEGANIS